MAKKAPGKAHRKGISIVELTDMFPDEESAVKWFEDVHWSQGRYCGKCGSTETREIPNRKPMPYWCNGCKSYFSVRTGTVMEKSRLPLRKWVFATYLYVTSLKGVSSMKLHRDLKITQKTAWHMMMRLREAWDESGLEAMLGPVEVDETYMGGKRSNMPKAKRKGLKGRGAVGKTVVVGAKDRASNRVSAAVAPGTDKATLHSFVAARAAPGSTVYTDDHAGYDDLPFKHESVKHSAGEYVRGDAHTQGIESFWSSLKRAHRGTFHCMSPKHLQRYVQEFAARHNIRDDDTIDQMESVAVAMVGKQLSYRELIADNGLPSGARPKSPAAG